LLKNALSTIINWKGGINMDAKRTFSVIKSSPSTSGTAKQRAAISALLATDEEYTNIQSYMPIDEDIGENLRRELLERPQDGTDLPKMSPQNILKVVLMDIQGYNNTKIGKELGMNESVVRTIKKMDSYITSKEQLLNTIIEGARQYMEAASVKAIKSLLECLDSPNERIKLMAAQDILNKVGLSTPQQIEVIQNNSNFAKYSNDELMEIMKKDKVVPKNAEVIDVGTVTDAGEEPKK
jgi:hypothetical protein